jgi:ABC-type branched-subunit amino acid transport system ATPase component
MAGTPLTSAPMKLFPHHYGRSRATAHPEAAAANPNPVGGAVDAVRFDRVSLAFDDNVVLRDLSFSVPAGHMTILIGASGVGKSVVLKLILGLLKPDSGVIRVNGERIDTMTENQMMRVRDEIGMLFQESALFDSLTVAEKCRVQALRRNRHACRSSAASCRGSASVHRAGGVHRQNAVGLIRRTAPAGRDCACHGRTTPTAALR